MLAIRCSMFRPESWFVFALYFDVVFSDGVPSGKVFMWGSIHIFRHTFGR